MQYRFNILTMQSTVVNVWPYMPQAARHKACQSNEKSDMPVAIIEQRGVSPCNVANADKKNALVFYTDTLRALL